MKDLAIFSLVAVNVLNDVGIVKVGRQTVRMKRNFLVLEVSTEKNLFEAVENHYNREGERGTKNLEKIDS